MRCGRRQRVFCFCFATPLVFWACIMVYTFVAQEAHAVIEQPNPNWFAKSEIIIDGDMKGRVDIIAPNKV